jgi:hypothetical protein
MAMNNLDPFSYDDGPEDWKEGKDRRKGGLAIDHEERNMVHLQPIGQIADACPSFIGMCDDDDFVAAVDKFLKRKLAQLKTCVGSSPMPTVPS